MGFQPSGTYETPDGATFDRMYQAIAALRSESLSVNQDVVTTGSWDSFFDAIHLGDGANNGQGAALNFAADLQRRIELLGWRIQDVESGAWSSREWFEAAKLFHEQLQGISRDVKSWSFEGLGSAYLRQTGEDVSDDVTQAMHVAAGIAKVVGTPWFLWGAVALGVLVVFGPELRALGRVVE